MVVNIFNIWNILDFVLLLRRTPLLIMIDMRQSLYYSWFLCLARIHCHLSRQCGWRQALLTNLCVEKADVECRYRRNPVGR
jgi:hypothetical protein